MQSDMAAGLTSPPPDAAAPSPPPVAVKRRRRWKIDLIALLIILAAVAIPITVIIIGQRRSVMPAEAWASDIDEHGRIRPLAEVARVTREAKIITLSVDATVRATIRDDRWRGNASATVEAPVKYSFGVDLKNIDDSAFRYDYLTRSYVVTLPPPTRIAVEVDGAHPVREVIDVSGTRFKALAGREQLIKAQKAIYDEAHRAALPPDQRQQVRDGTRQQLTKIVTAVVGDKHAVKVRFTDE
jgi:hypothetical protein